MDEADNKFYVDNTNRKVIFYNNDLVYKQSIISDTSSIFYGKTINSCLTELYLSVNVLTLNSLDPQRRNNSITYL